jgi:glycosyltransferase involved in cell wall biosynthesis
MIYLTEHPLITFAIFAYNQERFVREAVEGALAQTYSPLEIVLSDDFSYDRTFEIMKEMAACYNGPHKLVLNRNSKNLGVGDHVNRVMELAQGALVVAAAGDDISCPQRTRVLYEEWLKQNRRPSSIHSDYAVINENGSMIEDDRRKSSFSGSRSPGTEDIRAFLHGKHPANRIHGATHAWSNQLFKNMPALNSNVFFEDRVIGFRSLVIGSFAYVPQKLIYYRMHSNNLTGRFYDDNSQIMRFKKGLLLESANCFRFIAVLENFRNDVSIYVNQGVLSQDEGIKLLHEIDLLQKLKRRETKVFSGSPLIILAWFLRRLIFHPERSYTFKTALFFLKRIKIINSSNAG